MREQRPYSVLRVQVPTFLLIAIRQLVKEANANPDNDLPTPWTISMLMERWLLSAITAKEMTAIARKSPEFKQAAEEWLKWQVRQARHES
jgi:hypothetical protein